MRTPTGPWMGLTGHRSTVSPGQAGFMRPINEPEAIGNIKCIYHWVVGEKRVFMKVLKEVAKKKKKMITHSSSHAPL